METARTTLSNNLLRIRLDLDLNQVEAAERIGVTQTTYSRWENGLNQPKFEDLDRISAGLKVSIAQLYDDGSLPRQELNLYETFERLGSFLNIDVSRGSESSNVPRHISQGLSKVSNFTAIESALNATLKAENKSIDKSKKDVG